MLSDTTEFQPPSPAFRNDNISLGLGNSSMNDVGLATPMKRAVTGRSRFNMSIASLLSFHSKSSQHGAIKVDQRTKSLIDRGDSPYLRNGQDFGSSTPAFHTGRSSPLPAPWLSRVSAAFRRPSTPQPRLLQLPHEELAVMPPDEIGRGSGRALKVIIPDPLAPQHTIPLSQPTAHKDDPHPNKDHDRSERRRLANFRFGGAAHNDDLALIHTLPSPSDGLFESSKLSTWTRSRPPSPLAIITPGVITSAGLVQPPLIDSPLDHIFPLPSSLSPLLGPCIQPVAEHSIVAASTPTPSPTLEVPAISLRDRANRLTILPTGVQSPYFEEALLSPSLTRSRSPSQSDEDSTLGTPTLLESALSLSGCTLKDSASPRTLAASDFVHRGASVIVERPIERGVWGLTHLPVEQIVMPLSASIVFEDSSEDGSEDEIEYAKAKMFSLSHTASIPKQKQRRSQSFSVTIPSVQSSGKLSRSLSFVVHEHTSGIRRLAMEAEGGRGVTLIRV
ncbi:hypothetical protein V5O48_007852 [Marasmius crinis-equi]|uniref:Uncharacterized protein n=1 Tax=Marasmius crinis-equi TaxID=585013 RepID=A0ABR3FFY5_9AGAR